MKYINLMILNLMLFISYSSSFAGISSGGGTKDTVKKTPWFMQEKEVTYCLETEDSEEESLGNKNLLFEDIDSALKAWKQIIKDLQKEYKNESYFDIDNQAFKRLEICSEDTLLKFHFGSIKKSKSNQLFKNMNLNEFYGFAQPTESDENEKTAKGIVFLSSDFFKIVNKDNYNSPAIKLALLHELGHVFGFSHCPGTFMDELFVGQVAKGVIKDLRFSNYVNSFINVDRFINNHKSGSPNYPGFIAKFIFNIFCATVILL